ncbi:MAG: zinc ribbon domain-containing protein [Treponema sp.]|nr:zinc ribbon domain-containing protein [Treponema sp.]
MNAVCTGCGRTIDKEFIYCPWCGFSRVSHESDSLDVLFNKYEQMHREIRRRQLSDMEKQLDEMEKELSVLVLSTEMHK